MPGSLLDIVTARARERGIVQFVAVGAGGYATGPGPAGLAAGTAPGAASAPGVRWWHADPGAVITTLTGSDFEPDTPAMFCCDAAASQLTTSSLATVLTQARSLATPGTRVAILLPPDLAGSGGLAGVLDRSRWRPAAIPQPAQDAGLRLLAPVWAPAVPGDPPTVSTIASFTERMLYRSASDAIPGHLRDTYGVRVRATRELDVGVHRVDLAGGASWIARLFPAARDPATVRQDADLLAWLTAAGFPAERCAAGDPVSVLDGQPLLVTERSAGRKLAAKPDSFALLGRLLGQLHTMDTAAQPAAQRPGGAWHHLLAQGSPAQELTAARDLLHAARHRVHAGDGELYDSLAAALAASDSFGELPHAFAHPDFAPANVIGQAGQDITVIDWSGAGRAPRIVSLGCLLWSASGSVSTVEAAIAGYREQVTPEPGETARIGAAMRLRPLVLACWMFSTGRSSLASAAARWNQHRRRIEAAAPRALDALTGPPAQ